jgi:hypothetical protein
VRRRIWDHHRVADTPPDGLPIYRLLTGPDDDAFCHRVSEALELGYELYGSPAVTFDGERVIAAQALIWQAGA